MQLIAFDGISEIPWSTITNLYTNIWADQLHVQFRESYFRATTATHSRQAITNRGSL